MESFKLLYFKKQDVTSYEIVEMGNNITKLQTEILFC